MTTRTVEQGHAKYLMPAYGEGFTLTSRTVADMISECLATGIMCFLAEEEHLAEEFFKLESLEAGEILQKFRNYGIRFAVVVSPDRLRAGRFREMVSEEKKGHWFSAFTQRVKAEEWLADKPRVC